LLSAPPAEFTAQTRAAAKPFGVPRVQVEGVWVAHDPVLGSQIFETETSQEVLGQLIHKGLWTIAPEFRGTGLAAKVSADYYFRYGRNPSEFLWLSLNAGFTPEGGRAFARVYKLCVARAVAEGIEVEQCVRDSAVTASERLDALRAGDDTALVDDRTRRRLRAVRGKRFAVVQMRRAYFERLPNNLQRRALERLVVVAD
jgi:hypothetical protein